MEFLCEAIDSQMNLNRGLNLFFRGVELHFSPIILSMLEKVKSVNYLQQEKLIIYATEKTLQECYRINQYYSFDRRSIEKLKGVYSQLIKNAQYDSYDIGDIESMHCNRLRDWLKETNPFAGTLYINQSRYIEAVPCFEYTVSLQLNVLQLDIASLLEPVLDIGCGQHAHLVEYLRCMGIEAYGIDRYPSGKGYILQTDWSDFNYGTQKWGSIISHLGFSNHFMHHHLRNDGDFRNYAYRYMQILGSLVKGGSFLYAPGLPFIEQYLDPQHYNVVSIPVKGQQYQSVIVTRLK